MEWFKKTYLSTSSKLDILDVGSLDKKGNYNYSTIFNEKNWTYTLYSAGKLLRLVSSPKITTKIMAPVMAPAGIFIFLASSPPAAAIAIVIRISIYPSPVWELIFFCSHALL